MVTYAQWVRICRETAARKGANLSEFETNSAIVSVAADIWNENRAYLNAASESQARDLADEEIVASA